MFDANLGLLDAADQHVSLHSYSLVPLLSKPEIDMPQTFSCSCTVSLCKSRSEKNVFLWAFTQIMVHLICYMTTAGVKLSYAILGVNDISTE